jgi:hypothetical protein
MTVADCELVERQLFELREASLDDAATGAVLAHLARCSNCRALVEWDRRFTETLRTHVPETPSAIPYRIANRIRRQRRRVAAIAYAMAATVLIAGVLSIWRPWTHEGQTIAEFRGKSPTRSDDLAELPILFDPPPVDSLDVLARQQNGYVVALRRLGEE